MSSTQLEGMVPSGQHGQVTDREGTREPEAIGMSDEGAKKRGSLKEQDRMFS